MSFSSSMKGEEKKHVNRFFFGFLNKYDATFPADKPERGKIILH